MKRFVYDNEHDFVAKLKELVDGGTPRRAIEILAPHPVHDAEEILALPPSKVRLFALTGALLGAATGYCGNSVRWSMISKPRADPAATTFE